LIQFFLLIFALIDQRGLSDTSPGNYRSDVDLFVCQCTVKKNDILLSTKNISSRNGQSGYRNLLRPEACWRLASSDTRSNRAPLPSSAGFGE
jgi:hypothetical protein